MEPPAVIKKLRPFAGIVGIGPDLRPSEGYDQCLFSAYNFPPLYDCPENTQAWLEGERLPAEDRRELADYMIGLWQKYRDQIN